MTAAEVLVARTTSAQGLPAVVVDAAILACVAALLTAERGSTPAAGPGHCKDESRPASSRRRLRAG